MNINPDDPKWTAYVLGELSDAERAQVEKELESSALAREAVEEIRLATGLLKEEFAKELPAVLSADQRQAIAAAAAPARKRPVLRWAFAAGSIAAAVLVGITLWTARTIPVPEQLASESMPVFDNQQVRTEADQTRVQTPPPGPGKNETITQLRDSAGRAVELQQQKPQGQQGQQSQQGQLQTAGEIAGGVLGGAVRAADASAPAPPSVFPTDLVSQEQFRIGVNSFAERGKAVEVAGGIGPAPGPIAPDRADRQRLNTEAYDYISDNPFILVSQDPLATFSSDVDTASYANIRRFLSMNQLPPKDSVRVEEMINYFTYDYLPPTGAHPIAIQTEVAAAPWKPEHRLVRVAIRAKDMDISKRPPSNIVFLVDVSSSMATPEKLPLLQRAMKLMIERLGEGDHVAIVSYAGVSGLRLPSTGGDRKDVINAAIDSLTSGGSTNGGAGIILAYETAAANFIRGGINRVILATDGDFNVGVTSQGELTRLVEEKARSGVFLSVLGFGMGNYKDSSLEKLADRGNGNYAYIDTLNEARKVLVEEMSGTLMTVAKDVKIQVEFNPAEVNAYRLIGYENRALRHQDFNDDQKDAGDVGAGQTVTALFEIVPRGVEIPGPGVDPLKYQQPAQSTRRAPAGELLNVRVRYREPEGSASQAMETPVVDRGAGFANASVDFRFAAAVASFGMILRDSPHKGQASFDAVIEIAEKSKGSDRNGYREEFVQLVRKARSLK